MKLIVLMGLAVIEKIQLVQELAAHFSIESLRVHVIDNLTHFSINNAGFNLPVQLIAGDITIQLEGILQTIEADVVLLALSEQTHPDDFFIALAQLSDKLTDIDIRTVALIDLRTCDCFPHLRQAYESYADLSILLPYDMDAVLDYVSH